MIVNGPLGAKESKLAVEKAKLVNEKGYGMVQNAHRLGVNIAFGTDAFVPVQLSEFELRAKILPSHIVLQQATCNGGECQSHIDSQTMILKTTVNFGSEGLGHGRQSGMFEEGRVCGSTSPRRESARGHKDPESTQDAFEGGGQRRAMCGVIDQRPAGRDPCPLRNRANMGKCGNNKGRYTRHRHPSRYHLASHLPPAFIIGLH